MDANPDLVLPRRRDFYLFDPQYFGASGLMKTYDACHDTPPAKATNSLVTRARLGRSRPEHGVGQHRDLEALLGLNPGTSEESVVELGRSDAFWRELGL